MECRTRHTYAARIRLLQEECSDFRTIQLPPNTQDDCDVEQILPPVTVTDGLLQQCAQFLGDDVFNSTHTQLPTRTDRYECVSANRFIHAHFDRNNGLARFALFDPLPVPHIVFEGITDRGREDDECFSFTRGLPLNRVHGERHTEYSARCSEAALQQRLEHRLIESGINQIHICGKIEVYRASIGMPDEIKGIASLENEHSIETVGGGNRMKHRVLGEAPPGHAQRDVVLACPWRDRGI